ncbi:RNB domain-containing ribonuclease [Sphingomonas sp. Leaf38]|uniref:RNB domain-containing ribonuclease n=1 Tax=Sphingomonas sp. Leaf38 TaxID=1736217 RepID=UPI0006FE9AA1|nr:RNB domain-containing ribonuclease [Sphingomonas sp. Leaf38]KQN24731.1 ribonuclease [Sphingomonas sp. Leaf38]
MKTLLDPDRALADGLTQIRAEFQVPDGFPPAVIAAAEAAVRRTPTQHVDRTQMRFVTLDPAASTDLDQAFAIEQAGADLLLHYAIADVGWFVEDGDPLDVEAWTRGETLYLPDGKAGLYPSILSEGAASLLPDVERAAVIFAVRVAPDGKARLDGAERAIIRSHAKLGYETVQPADLPAQFEELARRTQAAERARGAARVDPPEQEVEREADGRLRLGFRPRLASEAQNAALSLATNLAVADALQAHQTGLFRVMDGPDDAAVGRLRHIAHGLGLSWPADVSLDQFSRSRDANDPTDAAFMVAIRRAGNGASYAPYREGVVPWHAAVAATYAQATAPLRRLADRYVIRAALAVATGQPVPEQVSAAFEALPKVMSRADARAGQINRAVIDVAEAVLLSGREGEVFAATVVDADERGARIQLANVPVVVRLGGNGHKPGDTLDVALSDVDVTRRTIKFVAAS